MSKAPEGTEKKEVQGSKTEQYSAKSQPSPGKKGYTPLPGGCQSEHCKTPASRFGFCPEHYEQFKFGLIKKTGEPVCDYEKKYEHYVAFKAKWSLKKAA